MIKYQSNIKNKETKKLLDKEKFLGVDRGGVEPQERGDKSAPGTGRTRPSNPRTQYTKYIYKNQKLPFREFLGSAGTDLGAGLSPYKQYTKPKSFVNSMQRKELRKQLKEGSLKRAKRDLQLAREWDFLMDLNL